MGTALRRVFVVFGDLASNLVYEYISFTSVATNETKVFTFSSAKILCFVRINDCNSSEATASVIQETFMK